MLDSKHLTIVIVCVCAIIDLLTPGVSISGAIMVLYVVIMFHVMMPLCIGFCVLPSVI